jgi:hypothetical protein
MASHRSSSLRTASGNLSPSRVRYRPRQPLRVEIVMIAREPGLLASATTVR